jgi:glycosyltransferase involved in cell wall biosynthesis
MTNPVPARFLSVLHVVLSLDGGGLERVVIDLAHEASALQQTASILCVSHPGVLAPKLGTAGVKLYCAEKGPGLRWSAVDAIRTIILKARPDVVHTHQISALLYVAGISRKLVPILVHTEHNNQFLRYRTARDKLRYLTMLLIAGRQTDRMFGVSEDATKSIRRSRVIASTKLFTVPNGVNLSRFQELKRDDCLRRAVGMPSDSFVLGNVGRLDEMKRPDLLVDAFARINAEFPNTDLLFVGDGPLMSDLRRKAADLKISARVHFTGFQENPEAYLGMMDVFVLTSRMEGMPLAVLEAAASGIPVIASRVGGLEEMSNAGRALLLYDFHDMDALHAKLHWLIRDCNFRRQIGQAGRGHVLSTYSSARMASDYNRHYRELLFSEKLRVTP